MYNEIFFSFLNGCKVRNLLFFMVRFFRGLKKINNLCLKMLCIILRKKLYNLLKSKKILELGRKGIFYFKFGIFKNFMKFF